MPEGRGEVILEDCKLLFVNFKGSKKQFNAEGDRNFNVVLPPDVADEMARDGWNVKQLKAREIDGETMPGDYVLEVAVRFDPIPPRVFMITDDRRTQLDEATVGLLDVAEIIHSDIVVTPYDWEMNGKTGRKAYLKSAYITIYQDALDRKYDSVPLTGGE